MDVQFVLAMLMPYASSWLDSSSMLKQNDARESLNCRWLRSLHEADPASCLLEIPPCNNRGFTYIV